MIVIIDAYNVLKHALHPDYIDDHHRSHFIKQIALYGKRKGHKMVVVFDGGPYERPTIERINGVQVVWSGVNQCADSYIKYYVRKHKGYELLMVSTDRELGRYAAHHKISSLDSNDFYLVLQQEIAKSSTNTQAKKQELTKTSEEHLPGLDEIMAQGSTQVPLKGEQVEQSRKSSARKLSKKERDIEKKIKKL